MSIFAFQLLFSSSSSWKLFTFFFFLFLNQQKLNIPREISSATRDFLGGDTSPPRPRVFSTIVISSSSFFVVVSPDVIL